MTSTSWQTSSASARDPATAERQACLGLSDDCYRVSIGLEAPEDLMADLARGLAAYAGETGTT